METQINIVAASKDGGDTYRADHFLGDLQLREATKSRLSCENSNHKNLDFVIETPPHAFPPPPKIYTSEPKREIFVVPVPYEPECFV